MAETLDLRRQIKRCSECAQTFSHDAMFCPFDGTKLVFAPWDPSGDPLLKQVVDGRYEVVGVLGEGGMGTVYDVVHTALHRHFAMKVLRRDLAREEDLAARFMNEARATASIKHPNIVAISDFGRMQPSGVPYFVMELLVGQTLSQSIKLGGPIPASRGIRIVLQIAAALGAAHKAKVVHRDLKPENVFLIGKADTLRDDVRVVDFGAAMILGASRVTKAGIVFGTPHYMSPEQASGQPVDHRADIYALGIIMYEMFTGKVPFEADTYMGVLTQHMFVQPVPPSQASPHARELGALEAVTLRALEKKPEHRYESMEQLAEEIQRVVTFTSDGGVRIAGASRVSKPVPSFKTSLADELELPSTHEIGAELTSLSVRRRRARAQRAAVYGGIAIAVTAISVGTFRFFGAPQDGTLGAGASPPASATSLSAPAAVPASPPNASAAPTSTTPSASATVNGASSASAPLAAKPPASAEKSAEKKVAPRAPAPASGAKRGPPSAATGVGEFVDPWAK